MKEIIILISTIFLLTSCYSNPKDLEKIKELENKINKLENNEVVFNKNLECKNIKNTILEDLKKYEYLDNKYYIDNIGYSKKFNSCIYTTSFNFKINNKNLTNYELINYFTGERIDFLQCDIIKNINCHDEIKNIFINNLN